MPIPRIFHFVFGLRKQTAPFHLLHYLCLESCLRVNQPDEIRLYYHHEPHGRYWDLVKGKISLHKVGLVPLVSGFDYSDPAIARYDYAHHADFIRLEKLLAAGGVYADMDTLFLQPLPEALYEKPFVLGREMDVAEGGRVRRSLCNALIMSAPGAPFCRRWLERMPAAFDGSWSGHSTRLPQELAEEFPQEIHIEPEASFYSIPPTPAGLARLFEQAGEFPPRAYSVHLWAHLWWSPVRHDFSRLDANYFTEDYIRERDSTFNCAARRYLPAGGRRTRGGRASLGRGRAGDAMRHTLELGKIIAKIAVYSTAGRILPRAQGHLAYARRQWAYHQVLKTLPAAVGIENHVIYELTRMDAYRIVLRRFQPQDVIVDVGAHIGVFSLLCHQRGARRIVACEPDAHNFASLRANLEGLEGIQVLRQAVFRSDQAHPELVHSGHFPENTGSGGVMFQQAFAFGMDQQPNPNAGEVVPAVGLDELLEPFEEVELLKLDCEGSEFPILLTSRQLGKVKQIVGEYHELDAALMQKLHPAARLPGVETYTVDRLVSALEAAGFQVTLRPNTDARLGVFDARRAQ
jgi:FkbM family methyltransferase